MKIVGTGCGPGLLTEEAIRAVSGATLLMGSRRALDLVSRFIPEGCEVRVVTSFTSLSVPDHAVVLSTGDPQLAGLGFLGGEIIPGISSLQLAASRLHIPLETVVVVDAHGRDHDIAAAAIASELERGRRVFVIADPAFAITDLRAHLAGCDQDLAIALCEDLGYPEERISRGTIADPPVPRSRLFVVFLGRFP
ncbi:MAG TPA: cobalt-precorrin-7 (C(5))-methyltransferase [Methanoregulaceae archaeon]|nr:cobalt-precorrin-7 (C(5))-methyltransferase [Methanoregulaceae archaeon]